MNNFTCTIWQFLMFGCTCLCGGIRLGVTIGRDMRQKEIDELRNRLLFKEDKANECTSESEKIEERA